MALLSLMGMQTLTNEWAMLCFGNKAFEPHERSCRFTEESIECAQSAGLTKEEVIQLVDYVFSRPVGDLKQEVGGTLLTLAALCTANEIDLQKAGETEIERVFDKIDQIREKHLNKPRNSPLPGKVG